jgi:hypothetical protein
LDHFNIFFLRGFRNLVVGTFALGLSSNEFELKLSPLGFELGPFAALTAKFWYCDEVENKTRGSPRRPQVEVELPSIVEVELPSIVERLGN